MTNFNVNTDVLCTFLCHILLFKKEKGHEIYEAKRERPICRERAIDQVAVVRLPRPTPCTSCS